MVPDITFLVYLPSTTPGTSTEFFFKPVGDCFFVPICVWADYDFYISKKGLRVVRGSTIVVQGSKAMVSSREAPAVKMNGILSGSYRVACALFRCIEL